MTLVNVILILAIICLIVHISYWLFFDFKIRKAPKFTSENRSIPVSIVICARNEEENLRNNLPAILKQKYHHFEVLVVDHCSTDKTFNLVSELQEDHINLKYFYCKDPRPSKRPALLLGLEKSTHAHILVTDADCRPVSDQWITKMVQPFRYGIEVVVGAAPLEGDRTLLSCFLKYEAASIYLQYAAATLGGFSYMGVGRNMAYLKTLYQAHMQDQLTPFIGGDDDLFVSRLSSQKVTLVAEESAMMISRGSKKWSEYYHKKHRHVSVSRAYSPIQKIYLGIFSFSHWGFLASILFLIIDGKYLLFAFLMLLVKVLISHLITKKVARPFVSNCPVSSILATEFVYLLHYPSIAFYLMLKPPTKW